MPATADQPTTALTRWRWLILPPVFVALLAPLVGHGCHGDDLDHEPTAVPTVRADVYNQP